MKTQEKLNMTMLCDFYELTMGNGYFEAGCKDRITYFDVFFRKVPDGGGFAIAAGLEQLIDYIENLHFTEEDIAYLRSRNLFCEEFLDYLRNFRFTGYRFCKKCFTCTRRAYKKYTSRYSCAKFSKAFRIFKKFNKFFKFCFFFVTSRNIFKCCFALFVFNKSFSFDFTKAKRTVCFIRHCAAHLFKGVNTECNKNYKHQK